jgi:hypothetical protein
MTTVQSVAFFSFILLLASCRSLSYFESPNNLRNVDAVLYLQNGTSLKGKLVVETDNLFSKPVKLYSDGEKKPMQFSLSLVKGYRINGNDYEVKEIREGISLGKRLYFMKRLTSIPSRIHLFEFMKKETVNKKATQHQAEYYLELPDEENVVYAANSSRFVPHFEEKVSRLVSDCPPLAQKIAHKKEGYFYAQVSLFKEKRADVLLRIIDEYNKCVE